jgi:hypothetical protein
MVSSDISFRPCWHLVPSSVASVLERTIGRPNTLVAAGYKGVARGARQRDPDRPMRSIPAWLAHLITLAFLPRMDYNAM